MRSDSTPALHGGAPGLARARAPWGSAWELVARAAAPELCGFSGLCSCSHREDAASPSWTLAGAPPPGSQEELRALPACQSGDESLVYLLPPSPCLAGRGLQGAAGGRAGDGGGLAHQSAHSPSSLLPPLPAFWTCEVLEQPTPDPS